MKRRFTPVEVFTAIVVLVVLTAIAVPMWNTHQLRVRREDATNSLRALQAAQDNYFGQHARYADEAELRASAPQSMTANGVSARGHYQITLRKSDDDLTYSATAQALPQEGETADPRCVELRIDQNGRLFAVDTNGEDRSADCWR